MGVESARFMLGLAGAAMLPSGWMVQLGGGDWAGGGDAGGELAFAWER